MNNNLKQHIPVLLDETLELLNIDPSGRYIDGTLGEAGHSMEILKRLGTEGELISFDHDPEAIQFVSKQYPKELNEGRWRIINENFSKAPLSITKGSIDGILLDLGLSSRHLNIAGRGFSFNNLNDPLDMRMDPTLGVTASDLINALDEVKLGMVFREYGEERFSRKIATGIKRSDRPILTVEDLNSAVIRAVPAASSDISILRRVYQSLRIAVNDEIENLRIGLSGSLELLKSGGRIVVISFHSLEDRAVKQIFKQSESDGTLKILTPKPITPSDGEIQRNRRSHSAKMRAAERI